MRKSIADRFWSKVKKTRSCWWWIGDKTKRGYGRLRGDDLEQKSVAAHRLSWKLNFGEIPKKLHVLHHCDNPACVRPGHLFLGTQADNNKDCCAKGRQPGSNGKVRGDRHPKHKLSWSKIRRIRSTKRSADFFAEKYQVHRSLIYRIRANKTWVENRT